MVQSHEEMLYAWKSITDLHLKQVSLLLSNLSSIGKDYEDSKMNVQDTGFNVFRLTSDFFYRENYHSDIIKAFLDPSEKHNENGLFLKLFIDMLNKAGKSIDKNDYVDARVVREEGRIDILIKSETTKRVIIIENKINNAGDMPRQLPRYYDDITSSNFKIDAIVYLPLDKSKQPDETSWTKQDRINVHQHLIIIPAYSLDKSINLVDNWINPAIYKAKGVDCISILRQYSDLIKFLNSNIMDTIVLDKFYKMLFENDNFETAKSIRNMMNALPEYMAIRLEDKYRDNHSPFVNTWRYKESYMVFEGYIIGTLYFKLDIWCNESGYHVHFWESNEGCDILKYFESSNLLAGFEYYENKKFDAIKHFDFNDEGGLCLFIDSFLIKLEEIKTNNGE